MIGHGMVYALYIAIIGYVWHGMVWYSFQFQAGQIALLERGLRWCWYGVVPWYPGRICFSCGWNWARMVAKIQWRLKRNTMSIKTLLGHIPCRKGGSAGLLWYAALPGENHHCSHHHHHHQCSGYLSAAHICDWWEVNSCDQTRRRLGTPPYSIIIQHHHRHILMKIGIDHQVLILMILVNIMFFL